MPDIWHKMNFSIWVSAGYCSSENVWTFEHYLRQVTNKYKLILSYGIAPMVATSQSRLYWTLKQLIRHTYRSKNERKFLVVSSIRNAWKWSTEFIDLYQKETLLKSSNLSHPTVWISAGIVINKTKMSVLSVIPYVSCI